MWETHLVKAVQKPCEDSIMIYTPYVKLAEIIGCKRGVFGEFLHIRYKNVEGETVNESDVSESYLNMHSE